MEGGLAGAGRAESGRDFVAGTPVHEAIAATAGSRRDHVAVVFRDRRQSYAELDALSRRMSAALALRGVGRGDTVGVAIERCLELPALILAILRVGAIYVPIDPMFPAQRIALIVERARLALHIGDAAPDCAVGAHLTIGAFLSQCEGLPAEMCVDAAPAPADPSAPAYLMFTSGSTGIPKGVLVPHGALANFMVAMRGAPGLDPADVLLAVTTVSFDISLLELLLPLCCGATLVIAAGGEASDADRLSELVREHAVSVLQATPSTWRMLLQSGERDLSGLKCLCGGEKLDRGLAVALLGRVREVWNLYGPTEATIWCSVQRIAAPQLADGGASSIPLGRPIAGARFLLVDEALRPIEGDGLGELCIAGECLASGYWNDPERTAAAFVEIADAAGRPTRHYRTGDIVRRIGSEYRYVERKDHQVKLNGYRIELGEIEHWLDRLDGVRKSVVVLRQAAGGGPARLVAYLESDRQDGDRLREDARRVADTHLAQYMRPRQFVVVSRLPLTDNGKVDRKALPPPEEPGPTSALPHRQGIAAYVGSLVEGELGVEAVDDHTDFLALGLTSLQANILVSGLNQRFGLKLNFGVVLSHPTVARLSTQVEAALAAREGAVASRAAGDAVATVDPAEPSVHQRRMWVLTQIDDTGCALNICLPLLLEGEVDRKRLRAALAAVLERHPALRTAFHTVGHRLQTAVAAPDDALVEHAIEFRTVATTQLRNATARDALIAQCSSQAFDLAAAPLVRLVCHGADSTAATLLCLTVHHIVCDGISTSVLLDDLARACRGEALGGSPHADEAAIAAEEAASGLWTRQLEYWRGALRDAPTTSTLLSDFPRPSQQTFRGSTRDVELDAALVEGVQAAARRQHCTPFTLVLFALGLVLRRHARQDDLVVGTQIANRNYPGQNEVVGLLGNTLALRLVLDGGASVSAQVRAVDARLKQDYAHSQVPFDRVLDALGADRSASHTPLFQVMLLHNAKPGVDLRDAQGRDLRCTHLPERYASTLTDLYLNLVEDGSRLRLEARYCTALYEDASIAVFLQHVLTALGSVCTALLRSDGDATRIDDLPIMSERERAVLLGDRAATRREWTLTSVPALVAEQARERPDAMAIEADGECVDYAALDRLGRVLAARLRQAGVGRGDFVGLHLSRSILATASMLACWRIGAAYLPLDPDYPAPRLRHMLTHSTPRVIVEASGEAGEPAGVALDAAGAVPRLRLVLAELLAAPEPVDASPSGQPFDAALPGYVLYTSASTGEAKGVVVGQGALLNHLLWMREAYPLAPGERVAHKTSLNFVDSVAEVWATLIQGATLCVVPAPEVSDFNRLLDRCRQQRIQRLVMVPSLLSAMLKARPTDLSRDLPALTTLMLGGEPIPPPLVGAAHRQLPGVALVNLYGATELAADALARTCSPADAARRRVALGSPIANTQAFVLDEALRICPVNVPGDLFVAGACVSLGYLRDNTLRAHTQPLSILADGGIQAYRTGDIARRLPDGNIEYLGRADGQLKIRGHRIEPREVEAEAATIAGVQKAAVAASEGELVERFDLVVEPTPGSHLDAEAVLRALRARVPTYLVPSRVHVVPRIPQLPNGKTDYVTLRQQAARAACSPWPPPSQAATPAGGIHGGVCELVGAVLGVGSVDVQANFFDLGGTSLTASILVNELNRRYGTRLTVVEFMRGSRVADLVEALQGMPRPGRPVAEGATRQAPPQRRRTQEAGIRPEK